MEAIMRYAYKDFTIDATPDFSLGRFFARARIIRDRSAGKNEGETYDLRDLAECDIERDAITFAHMRAVSWIDEHERPINAPDA
jgi:hypothetical protein